MQYSNGGGRGLEPGSTGRRPVVWEDARWRRDQSARRRVLTARGRATVSLLLGGVLALVFFVSRPFEPYGEDARRIVARTTPPVAAPPQAENALRRQPGRAPERLLERPPFTPAALALTEDPSGEPVSGRLVERVARGPGAGTEIEYTLDAELMRRVFRVLKRGRVALGNVVVMDPNTGRLLAYASTDPERFPPTRTYPAASLVKVITAAAALREAPKLARLPCRFTGSPYRLTASRIDPPEVGREVSLRRALATSNNQCLAQLAVHALGPKPLMGAIERFGWLDVPAPAHAAGQADPGAERLDLGRLGSGLAGSRITPLHAAQLAATLVHGELVSPWWVERIVAPNGRELDIPAPATPRRVLSPGLTDELRAMLVDTTRSGTARRAFRNRRGHPVLGEIRVAGKTGSLSGKDPDGRYEWFAGVAPADDPQVAIATVLVQDDLWWRSSSQIAADVLQKIFCDRQGCDADNAGRFLRVTETTAAITRRPHGFDRVN